MLGKIRNKWNPDGHAMDTDRGRLKVLSREQLMLLIRYERLRVDRNNSCFTLILWEVTSLSRKEKLMKQVDQIRSSMREIDLIGWYDLMTLGILLPDTDYEGALHFSSHLRKKLSGPHWNEKILTYPSIEGDRKEDPKIMDFSSPIPQWKKALDKTGSLLGLLLFSPIFVLLPLYIKLVSRGPVFYCQTRVGYRGREFKFWKFRTMHCNTTTENHSDHLKDLINSDKPMTKLDERRDPRIIPGGRFIRKACLDELPQIYNIFRGDMSLVGPRPCIPYEAQEFLRWHKYRFDINPGLTGLWQVSGKNKLTFKEMIRLDITYSRNMSLLLDLRIIASTIPAILKMVLESVAGKIIKRNKPFRRTA